MIFYYKLKFSYRPAVFVYMEWLWHPCHSGECKSPKGSSLEFIGTETETTFTIVGKRPMSTTTMLLAKESRHKLWRNLDWNQRYVLTRAACLWFWMVFGPLVNTLPFSPLLHSLLESGKWWFQFSKVQSCFSLTQGSRHSSSYAKPSKNIFA